MFTEEAVLQGISSLRADVPSLRKEVASLREEVGNSRKDVKLVSSKADLQAMNLERLCRYVLPGEKVVKRPENLPSLPVDEQKDLAILEKFLSDGVNLSAAVSSTSLLSYIRLLILFSPKTIVNFEQCIEFQMI